MRVPEEWPSNRPQGWRTEPGLQAVWQIIAVISFDIRGFGRGRFPSCAATQQLAHRAAPAKLPRHLSYPQPPGDKLSRNELYL